MLAASTDVSDTVSSGEKTSVFIQNDVVLGDGDTVLSGSTEALLLRLVPTRDFSPDASYIFTLLVNIRTFISPEQVLQHLVQNCMFSVNSDSMNFNKENRTRLFRHVLRVCAEWVTSIPYDFRSPSMRDRLAELLGMCSVDNVNKQRAAELIQNLNIALNRLDRYELAMASLKKTLSEGSIQPSSSDSLTGLSSFDADPKLVAQQLTHIELERFGMVGLDEFVMTIAKGNISELGKTTSGSSSGCIDFYIEWLNHLSSLVASEILRHNRRRNRVQVMEFLIDVAQQCCEIGTFNSLMAIVAGLSLPPVARLKRTWSRVDKTKLEILQHQLDPSGNFLSYRATMKAAVWRASHCDEEKIVVPFFVLLLKDLFLIYHNISRTLPNGHWNFLAFSQFADQLRNVQQWKQSPCPFPKHPQVLQYLLISPVYSENDALLVSFNLESAETTVEKQQLKHLKTLK